MALPRDLKRFADLSDRVFDGPAGRDPGGLVPRERPGRAGPARAPADQRPRYDLVLFWTFRFHAPSFFGLPLVADRVLGAGRGRRSISTS
ncbi:MAG: hypothetical protein R2708_05250 [Vicinamibacterales bacterium]